MRDIPRGEIRTLPTNEAKLSIAEDGFKTVGRRSRIESELRRRWRLPIPPATNACGEISVERFFSFENYSMRDANIRTL
jgi:hypothetical protein